MTLAEIEVPTEEIRVGKGSFKVRGISFLDLSILISDNRADLDRVVDLFAGLKNDVAPDEFLLKLVREMPTIVAKVIAHAADEPASHAKVLKLPVPAQLEAARAVARLTFEEAGGVKKFVEQLVSLLGDVNNAIPDLLASPSSTGAAKAAK